jgi:mannan endo-1,4-beta-mannosidase
LEIFEKILWRTNNDLSSVDLDSVIQESINQKLIPMVELHDATGSSNSADLQRLAQWWANNVWLLIKHRRLIIVNIANEWSPWGYKTSFSSYLISTNSLINILKTLNIFMERCL